MYIPSSSRYKYRGERCGGEIRESQKVYFSQSRELL